MLFSVTNRATGGTTHCGVLEFIADEGHVYMPYWVRPAAVSPVLCQTTSMHMHHLRAERLSSRRWKLSAASCRAASESTLACVLPALQAWSVMPQLTFDGL